MPIIKSAIKRVRQESVRRARNRLVKDEIRSAVKLLERAIESGDGKKANEQLRLTQSQFAIAVKKNIMEKNTAARRLSRLNARVKTLAPKRSTPKKTAAKKPSTKSSK